MTMRAVRTAALGLALAVGGCKEATGLGFGDTGVLGGGYGAGGFQGFGQELPPGWRYLYPPGGSGADVGGVTRNCVTDAFCGLGGRTSAFGLANGGATFLYVSTENVPTEAVDGPRTIQVSGIGTEALTLPNADEYEALRLVLDWAFLTSRSNPAAANDSAIVRVRAGNESVVVLRVTTADLLAGRQPRRAGGCEDVELFRGRFVTYATCTDWITTEIDLTAWLGRTFEIQFIVAEAGTRVEGADQPAVFLFRRAVVEGGR